MRWSTAKNYIDDYFFFIKGTETFAFYYPVVDWIYLCVLQKAYLKYMGNFAEIHGGLNEDAFWALTASYNIVFESSKKNTFTVELINYCSDKLKEGSLFSFCKV